MKILLFLGKCIEEVWNILKFFIKCGTIVAIALFFVSVFYFENVVNAINFFKNFF